MNPEITLEASPDEAAQKVLAEGLARFNAAQVGPEAASPLWVVARDPDGAVIGGLQGVVWWTWFYVNMLWVDERSRGIGLGSAMLERAERLAVERGCKNAFLFTMSFQAPDFYRRRGYDVFGDLEEFPGVHRQFWMRKRLVAG